jgi:4-amino-4-deoxy-L-arabinose transferase-like glycosyltransferase
VRAPLPLRTGLLALVALALVQIAAGFGSAPLMRAEIYFLDGARSMLERGDLLIPYYEGAPFFDKPPLTYWLIAAAFRLFGYTAAAARVVPAAAAVLALAATVWLGRRLFDTRTALAGGLVLATTFGFVSFARVAMSDMLLALACVASVALGVEVLLLGRGGWRLVALGAVLGLGFLTKGPVALLLPGLGLLALAWQRRDRLPRPDRFWALGALAFALAGLSWFGLVAGRLGSAPLVYFFLRENLERFAGETYDAQRPFWYYLSAYLAEGAPWSLLMPAALLSFRRGDTPPEQRSSVRFLLGWLGLMLVPLSLSRGKLDYYLLPLYPAASLLIGHWLAAARWQRFDRASVRVVLVLAALGLLAGTALPGRIPEPWLPPAGARAAVAGLAVAAALVALLATRRPTPGRSLGVLAGLTAGLFVAVSGVYLPAFRSAQPNAAIVEDVSRERHYRSDAGLALCDDPVLVARDVLFQARLAPLRRCDLWNPAASQLPFMVFVPEQRRDDLMEIPSVRFVGRYTYLPGVTLTLQGLLEGPRPAELALIANYPTQDPISLRRNRRDRRRAVRERQSGAAGPLSRPSAEPHP